MRINDSGTKVRARAMTGIMFSGSGWIILYSPSCNSSTRYVFYSSKLTQLTENIAISSVDKLQLGIIYENISLNIHDTLEREISQVSKLRHFLFIEGCSSQNYQENKYQFGFSKSTSPFPVLLSIQNV